MKVYIFGGTTEGRLLTEEHIKKGDEVTVSVATEMGAEELKGLSADIRVGRMDVAAMTAAVKGYDLVIDATHPYATEASMNISSASATAGVLYQRIERDTAFDGQMPKDCFYAKNHFEAAEYLLHTQGNILLTTGSKNMAEYADVLPAERLYVRVLPTHEALTICEECNIPHSHIIAMHGPFSEELNTAMIRQYDISHLVTKESGTVGGFPEKVESCIKTGTGLLVVRVGEA